MGSFTNPYPAGRLTVDSTNSLVPSAAFFPLTEGTGSVVDCILHPSHTGTVTSGAWQTGDGGTELSLSGNASFVTIGDLNLNSSNGLTVTAWIDGPSYGNQKQIVTRDNSGGSRHWQFRISNGGKLQLIRFDSSNTLCANFVAATTLTHNERYFVAFTFDSSSGSVIYLDGEADGTDSNTTANNSGTGTDILIGARRSSGNIFNSLNAGVQNCRIYERALSASEIATLYHRPWEGSNYGDIWPYSPPAASSMTLSSDTSATSLMTNCVGWWPLTTTTGNTTEDISGQGNDATKTGAAWADTGVGYAFDQSPTEAGLNAGSSANNFHGSSFSVSAWVWTDDVSGSTEKHVWGCWNNAAGSIAMRVRLNQVWVLHDAGYSLFAVNAVEAKKWHNILVTYDGSAFRIYIDGAFAKIDGRTLGASNTEPFYIGQKDNSTSQSFDGYIQNVRTWSRTLSADEALLLYERPWEGIEYGDTFHHDPPAPASMLPLTSDAINTDQVGWWPLTETDDYASGAADISGSSSTGTKSGGVTSQHSLTGASADFDNTGHIDVGKSFWDSGIVSANAFTFNAWFNVDNNTADHGIFGSWNSASEALSVWVDVGGTNVSLTAICGDGTTQAITSVNAPIVTTGQWHMGTVIFDGSANTLKVYLDGVYSNENSSATATLTTAPMGFHIGDDGSTSRTTEGLIQNCRLWSRVLTADEIWSIYANPWLGSNYKLASGSTPLYNYIFRTERFRRLG